MFLNNKKYNKKTIITCHIQTSNQKTIYSSHNLFNIQQTGPLNIAIIRQLEAKHKGRRTKGKRSKIIDQIREIIITDLN